MPNIVTGPLVVAKRQDGSDVYLYEGAEFPDGLKSGELARFVELGFVSVSVSDGGSYGSLKVDELKAEITKRNEGREEADMLSLEGKKADLVATLEADDGQGD
jgi:hypothetical protein